MLEVAVKDGHIVTKMSGSSSELWDEICVLTTQLMNQYYMKALEHDVPEEIARDLIISMYENIGCQKINPKRYVGTLKQEKD